MASEGFHGFCYIEREHLIYESCQSNDASKSVFRGSLPGSGESSVTFFFTMSTADLRKEPATPEVSPIILDMPPNPKRGGESVHVYETKDGAGDDRLLAGIVVRLGDREDAVDELGRGSGEEEVKGEEACVCYCAARADGKG